MRCHRAWPLPPALPVLSTTVDSASFQTPEAVVTECEVNLAPTHPDRMPRSITRQEMNKTWLLSTPTAACLQAATREVAPVPRSPALTLPQAAKPNAELTSEKPQVPYPRAMPGGGEGSPSLTSEKSVWGNFTFTDMCGSLDLPASSILMGSNRSWRASVTTTMKPDGGLLTRVTAATTLQPLYTYVYVCIYILAQVNVSICMYISVYVCIILYAFICTYSSEYVCICIYMRICTYIFSTGIYIR
jgi:hypothetical protein